MSVEVIQGIAELVVLGAVGGVAAWKSWRAAGNTRETGNGFARHVKESLQDVKDGLQRVEKKVDDHIDAHADADIRRR